MATVTRIVSISLADDDGVSAVVAGTAVVAVEAEVGPAEKDAGAGRGHIGVGCSVLRADFSKLLALVTLDDHVKLDALPPVPDVKPKP